MNTDFSEKILSWYKINGRKKLPWKVKDPYKIWISEVMLQQTQVNTVIPYYNKFVASYPDLKSLSKASLDDLMLLWSGLGYYRRIKNIHLASQIITEKYNNKFPRNFDDILSLPGIGRTTASAISTFSGYSKRAILDGNVKRILRRYYNISHDNSSKTEKILWDKSTLVTPLTKTSQFIQAMMDIGSLICKRSKPNCSMCPLKEMKCLYTDEVKKISTIKKNTKKINMYLLTIINNKNQIYLKKIKSGTLWENLYSGPFFYTTLKMNSWLREKNLLNIKTMNKFQINHRVTNKEIKIINHVYFLKNDKNVSFSTENWYNLAEINVGIPKYLDKALEVYRSEYEKNNVQKIEKRG
tara:strand:- start:8569 stop:9630 length:1062 start_codon:yes stop_codon:yes gene_type:complete